MLQTIWDHTLQLIHDHETMAAMVWAILKIIILFVVIRVGINISNKIVKRALRLRGKMNNRRKRTMVAIFTKIIRYAFYFIFLLTVLPILNIHIGGLLAGAGVVGIAIAFAAQSLLKDFLNGFFIMLEDQYGEGDFVVINDLWGTVKSVGLRITSLQVWTGEVVIIPNGEISQVLNYSKENSIAVIDVKVGYDSVIDRALEIIKNVMDDLKEEQDTIVGDVSVLGVQELNDWNYTLRAIAECEPNAHWEIQRLAKQRLRAAFDDEGIELPLQKIVYRHDNQLPDTFQPENSVQPLQERA
ncbi:mechanosensitive ion channel family protein [Tuberibacillus sp. Marseille-P3662]|uniref:mechanosensitive ion channel family protein n=1 Tax=Tuberibacillus sp. Marseille-P3662 TaxID=1965358 RepID=UPI000A1CC309|nr:mechanosensitive ion channel family protein [Tuberibacillus sp. Marseille-P3662]